MAVDFDSKVALEVEHVNAFGDAQGHIVSHSFHYQGKGKKIWVTQCDFTDHPILIIANFLLVSGDLFISFIILFREAASC